MAGKFHCVTRKNHKFSSPTNPEVWYSSSCACTVKNNHGNSLESIQNKRKQKAFWSCVRSFIWSCGILPSKPEVAVPLSLDPLSGLKLAFVMQRLKNCPKNFCHDQRRWGGHSCYDGGHRAHGGPPTRENPAPLETSSSKLILWMWSRSSCPGQMGLGQNMLRVQVGCDYDIF